jgi:hypothetical protein
VRGAGRRRAPLLALCQRHTYRPEPTFRSRCRRSNVADTTLSCRTCASDGFSMPASHRARLCRRPPSPPPERWAWSLQAGGRSSAGLARYPHLVACVSLVELRGNAHAEHRGGCACGHSAPYDHRRVFENQGACPRKHQRAAYQSRGLCLRHLAQAATSPRYSLPEPAV